MTTTMTATLTSDLPDTLHPDNEQAYRAAIKANACEEGLAWLVSLPSGDWSGIPAEYADWALIGIPTALSPAQIDACADVAPFTALRNAANLLTPQRLDACARACSLTALECAAHLLTPERLDACAELFPNTALFYAAQLLTPKRLDWCAERKPRLALIHASRLLTPKRLAWCMAQVGE